MAKTTRELLFLKNSGVLIGEITAETDKSTLNLDSFVVKSVELDEDAGDYWYGDHANGEVRSRSERPVITESYVKYNTNVAILNEYPIHRQLNIIIDMLDRSEIVKTSQFVEMKEFLEAAKQNYREQIESYSSNSAAFTFVSEAEEKAVLAKKQNFE